MRWDAWDACTQSGVTIHYMAACSTACFSTKLCVWLTRCTILQPQRIWATWYSDGNTHDPSDHVQMVPCWLSREQENSMVIGRFQYGRPGTGTSYNRQQSGTVLTIKLLKRPWKLARLGITSFSDVSGPQCTMPPKNADIFIVVTVMNLNWESTKASFLFMYYTLNIKYCVLSTFKFNSEAYLYCAWRYCAGYTVLRYSVPGYTVLGYTMLGYSVLDNTVLGYTVLGHTVLGYAYCTWLHYFTD